MTVTVDDLHGGVDVETTTVVIGGVGVVDGTLYVIGTDGEDKVDVKLGSGGARTKLSMSKVNSIRKGTKRNSISTTWLPTSTTLSSSSVAKTTMPMFITTLPSMR